MESELNIPVKDRFAGSDYVIGRCYFLPPVLNGIFCLQGSFSVLKTAFFVVVLILLDELN